MFEPLNIGIRVLVALIFLFVATKVLTKRGLSKLTYFDYVAGATLGTIAGNLAFNIKIHMFNFVLALVLITLVIVSASYVSLKYRPLRKFLAGEPTVLIQNGKVLEKNLAKINYAYDYLNQQLRQEQVFDLGKVEFAVLEPDGKLSIQLKSQNRPLTPNDLGLATNYEGLATEVVLEGKVLEQNLLIKNISKEWLFEEMRKKGIHDINQVAFAAVATNGSLYVDYYRDY